MKMVQMIGDNVSSIDILAFNRTGATRSAGDVGMLDILGTQAETTSIDPDEDSVYANVTPAATAGLARFPMVVALEDIEDNKRGLWRCYGRVDVSVKDDAAATTDVDRGDGLSILNGDHDLEASATGNRVLGIALEDGLATGGPSLIKAVWFGGLFGVGVPAQA